MVQKVNGDYIRFWKEGAVAVFRHYPDIHLERARKTVITLQKVLLIC
jgi:hypothetical protein